jgi:L-ascorbate metabolism protein UlaG (beta-lactamase superfamily)
MAINDQVKFTWIGHGTWRAQSAKGREILIDPWVMNNPVAPDHLKKVDRCDLMLVTHGHYDHIWDAVDIAKQTGCTVHAVFETASWMGTKGVEKVDGGNKGGTHEFDGIKVTLVHAEHTCGISDPPGSNNIVYGGEACGLVIEFENGFTVYFAGDTDVFGDMKLIAELHSLDAVFLPIGDYYTMSPKRAAKAVELLGAQTVVPMHFGTFPPLVGRPSQLQELVGSGVKVLDIKPGDEV